MQHFARSIIGVACGIAAIVPAAAQEFPLRPVRFIVPFPPGGIDTVARMIAEQAASELGQPVVVENRPGANGMLGAELVARSAGDPHVYLFTSSSTLVSGVLLMKSAKIDPLKDFTPVSLVYSGSRLLAVHRSVPVRTLKELVELAKKRKLFYSSSGIGSAIHLNMEALKEATGMQLVHVPYKGTVPAAQALVAADVQVGLPSVSNVATFVEEGTVVPLAVLKQRLARYPSLPTIKELLPAFETPGSWIGYFGAPRIPEAVVKRMSSAIVRASHSARVLAYLEGNGNDLLATTPEEAAATLKADLANTGRIIKSLGLKPQ